MHLDVAKILFFIGPSIAGIVSLVGLEFNLSSSHSTSHSALLMSQFLDTVQATRKVPDSYSAYLRAPLWPALADNISVICGHPVVSLLFVQRDHGLLFTCPPFARDFVTSAKRPVIYTVDPPVLLAFLPSCPTSSLSHVNPMHTEPKLSRHILS